MCFLSPPYPSDIRRPRGDSVSLADCTQLAARTIVRAAPNPPGRRMLWQRHSRFAVDVVLSAARTADPVAPFPAGTRTNPGSAPRSSAARSHADERIHGLAARFPV